MEAYEIECLKNNNFHLQKKIEQLEREIADRNYRQLKERKFWTHDAGLWFALTEAEFRIIGITDDLKKFNYVITQLDKEVLIKVKDVILNPPVRGKYNKLKDELIRRYAEPEMQRIHRLFDEKLGDRTPSEFYRQLKYIAGPDLSVDKILLYLWMRQLPQQCQQILACRKEQTNLKLAELADSIMEVIKVSDDTMPVLEINSQQSDELGKNVVAFKCNNEDQSQSSSTSKQSSPIKVVEKVDVCWYHQVYGEEAYNCNKPCGWKKPEKE